MSVTYRPRPLPPVDPAEVRATFLRGGWRLLERNYGSSSPVLQQLIALAGGPALLAERAMLQGRGRKAGGNTVKSVQVEG